MAELRVPFRLGSPAYFRIGKDVHFRAIDPDQGAEDQFDIRVLTLTGPSCPTHPLERGEYLELESFEHLPRHLPRQLSGFPVSEQWRNYEKGEFGGDGITIGGVDAGPTGDAGCRFFRSDDLLGLPVDGMSGGAVTSNIFGSVQLEGICLRGAVKGGVDFIRYITIESLEQKLREAYRRTNQSGEDQRNAVA